MHNDHLPQLKKKAGKSGLCSPISRQCKTIVQTTVQIPLKCKLFVRLCNISFFATLRPQILLTLYIIVTYLCFLLSVKKYISFCAPYMSSRLMRTESAPWPHFGWMEWHSLLLKSRRIRRPGTFSSRTATSMSPDSSEDR